MHALEADFVQDQATRVVFQDYYTGSVFDEEGSKSVGRLLDFAIAAQLSRCPSQFMFDGVIYDVILSVGRSGYCRGNMARGIDS